VAVGIPQPAAFAAHDGERERRLCSVVRVLPPGMASQGFLWRAKLLGLAAI
jgi:hypothetical protein